jgi:hypothetical protein
MSRLVSFIVAALAALAALRHAFGTVDVAEALSYGCTHRGRFYGIPVYLGLVEDGEMPIVICRWRPAEAALPWVSMVGLVLRWLVTGREELAIHVGSALTSVEAGEVSPC